MPRYSKIEEKKFNVYTAYLVYELTKWKYEVYAQKDIHQDIKFSAPCSYSASDLLVEAIKRNLPEVYEKHKNERLIDLFDAAKKEIF